MFKDINPGSGNSDLTFSGERQRLSLLHGRRRRARRRIVEVGRDRHRNCPGQGHQSRLGRGLPVLQPATDEHRRHSVLPGRRRRAWRRTVEVRWNRHRNRHGQGHQSWIATAPARASHRRQRHALLCGRRRGAWRRIVEVGRDRRRNLDGPGHRAWRAQRSPGQSDGVYGAAGVLYFTADGWRPDGNELWGRTGPWPEPGWSRTSTRGQATPIPPI